MDLVVKELEENSKDAYLNLNLKLENIQIYFRSKLINIAKTDQQIAGCKGNYGYYQDEYPEVSDLFQNREFDCEEWNKE